MENLLKELIDTQKQEQETIKKRQKLEAEYIAKIFYKEGWAERGKYEDEKRASEAAKTLNNHKRKYHS